MKVRDLIAQEIDIDVYDDVCEELGIAFCGPMEQAGLDSVGRVIPAEYLWFSADGSGLGNTFRSAYNGGAPWDWSLDNPYEE